MKLFQSPMESIQIHHYHSWYEKTAGTSHWSRCYLLLEVRTRYSISPSRIIQERKGNCTRSCYRVYSRIEDSVSSHHLIQTPDLQIIDECCEIYGEGEEDQQ